MVYLPTFTIGIKQILKDINGIFQLLEKTPNLSDSFVANLENQKG